MTLDEVQEIDQESRIIGAKDQGPRIMMGQLSFAKDHGPVIMGQLS